LRDLCSEHETALIFDEVITGFRLSLGGAQEVFGVTPDLAIGIASGFPLSAVTSKAQFMDLISKGQVAHAGTYNSNPVAIAAGLATVQHLMSNQEAIYAQLYGLGGQLRTGLQAHLQTAKIPALVEGTGPVVQVSLTSQSRLLNYRDWARRDIASYQRIVTALAERGVRTIPRGTWYLSTAHSEDDLAHTLSAFADSLQILTSTSR
jgi:glutamate-1-semialdehyde 2,1-aminomutase